MNRVLALLLLLATALPHARAADYYDALRQTLDTFGHADRVPSSNLRALSLHHRKSLDEVVADLRRTEDLLATLATWKKPEKVPAATLDELAKKHATTIQDIASRLSLLEFVEALPEQVAARGRRAREERARHTLLVLPPTGSFASEADRDRLWDAWVRWFQRQAPGALALGKAVYPVPQPLATVSRTPAQLALAAKEQGGRVVADFHVAALETAPVERAAFRKWSCAYTVELRLWEAGAVVHQAIASSRFRADRREDLLAEAAAGAASRALAELLQSYPRYLRELATTAPSLASLRSAGPAPAPPGEKPGTGKHRFCSIGRHICGEGQP